MRINRLELMEQLKEGLQLDTSNVNSVYNGETTKLCKDIVECFISAEYYTKFRALLKVNNRVYEQLPCSLRYYSVAKGSEGRYYHVDDYNKLYDYLKKPRRKTPVNIKLIVKDKKDYGMEELRRL